MHISVLNSTPLNPDYYPKGHCPSLPQPPFSCHPRQFTSPNSAPSLQEVLQKNFFSLRGRVYPNQMNPRGSIPGNPFTILQYLDKLCWFRFLYYLLHVECGMLKSFHVCVHCMLLLAIDSLCVVMWRSCSKLAFTECEFHLAKFVEFECECRLVKVYSITRNATHWFMSMKWMWQYVVC